MSLKQGGKGSLERRLLMTLAAAAVLFGVFAGAAVYRVAYDHESERSRHTLDSLVATVQSSASIAMFVTSEEIGRDVMDGLLRNDEILAVLLESDTGYQVMRWNDHAPPRWDSGTEMSFPLYEPTFPRARIGQLTILPDTVLLTQRAQRAALHQLALLLGQTALLGIIGVVAFRRVVGRPLSRLTLQLQHVNPGSGERIEVPPRHGNTEIGLLADSVNGYLAASEAAIQSERALRERVESMEAHYKRIFESTSVGVMVLDLDGHLINSNAVLSERLQGVEAADPAGGARGADFFSRLFMRPDKAWALVEDACSTGHVAAADLELIAEPEAARQWVHCLLSVSRAPDGDFRFIEGVLYDVTSRREREQAALRVAERDGLTDLINRRGAEAYIDRALAEAGRNAAGCALLYVDLDGFKQANDTWGHAAGDALLVEVAHRLSAVLRRSSDLVARVGGDEFVLACYGCRKKDEAMREFAQAVLTALSEPIRLADGTRVQIGASIGLASYPDDGANRSALLFAADRAMYAAKRLGRNRCVVAGSAEEAAASDQPGRRSDS